MDAACPCAGEEAACTPYLPMVADDLWLTAVPDGGGMLCIACLGRRLGRELSAADFLPRQMNKRHYRVEERGLSTFSPQVHAATG